jgi:hypothetical protein
MDPLTNATVASAVTVRDSGSGPLARWPGSARPRAPKLGPGGPSGAAPQRRCAHRHAADRSAAFGNGPARTECGPVRVSWSAGRARREDAGWSGFKHWHKGLHEVQSFTRFHEVSVPAVLIKPLHR